MSTTAAPALKHPSATRATAWDRAAIVALGGAGCALSYDALQQMAIAIHVRGWLTFLFPLVVDGFIAYGVRALIILRTAPFRSRLYVWALFGTATTASIWANALHAVRLNQQAAQAGLRLGDLTVGVLSTLAPLALAGAVHLYILIARHNRSEPPTELRGTEAAPHPCDRTEVGRPHPEPQDDVAHPPEPARRQATPAPRYGRPPGADMDRLLGIARKAISTHGKSSRAVVRKAVREAGLTIAEDRLTDLMNNLRTESNPSLNQGRTT
ncbi:hypothetical protein SAZ_21565 [Streptomyces noursei ZPM]|uniref:DUF2637 domain-containing protein n=2 Tax=Streptomyces TaxID=1883 RepID=A0A4Q9HV98_STRKA|nr:MULTISPECIES: DUF2637 domain-containing protein [Streptomyces]AKA04756.1 hypothetical protein SAZ_21565 [Streptomyces noursei ZPM]EOS97388.1 hypothetical protein K530_44178 [Streptomyces noursei CCRC 11814]EXU89713.1 hypothetical protein P354_20175 [Streptomyces noursei PD-1]TBO59086.1 DUF2637 domain-containing protein [Streptomyces kasugaensis]UWS73130.1 DUF2637 domain-containing protein [Streptomyces noursei]